MEENNTYIPLIIKHLKHDTSEQEKRMLFKWVYSNNNNEKLYYHLKDIWETAKYDSTPKNVDVNHEWEKFILSSLEKESYKFGKKKQSNQNFKRFLQIAALIIVAFGIGFFVHKYIPTEATFTSISVPYGAKTQVDLPDGSKVWINSGSSIKYPANFEGKDIPLFLEGEAFFDIVKNPKRKLTVKTSSINIQVHGTQFNVRSYNDDDIVETTLLEGSISITGEIGNKAIKSPIYLKPMEQAVLEKNTNTIKITSKDNNVATQQKPKATQQEKKSQPSLKIIEKIDAQPFVAWKDNKLIFKKERLEDLAIKMERWYDIKITILDEELKDTRYTGTFEKETIEQAINALCISKPFSYSIEKNEIEIKKTKR